jgi:uncharacterized membrane protein
MNITHIHLLLNHVPVIGFFFGVLLLAYGLARRSDELQRVALGFFVILGVFTIAVFLTGEPAEDAVKNLAGFSKAIAERHEEAALAATVALSVIGATALVSLVLLRRKPIPRAFGVAALVVTIVTMVPLANAANLGGQIRHTEIRLGAASLLPNLPAEADRDGDHR